VVAHPGAETYMYMMVLFKSLCGATVYHRQMVFQQTENCRTQNVNTT